jgi:hypothetical protein
MESTRKAYESQLEGLRTQLEDARSRSNQRLPGKSDSHLHRE